MFYYAHILYNRAIFIARPKTLDMSSGTSKKNALPLFILLCQVPPTISYCNIQGIQPYHKATVIDDSYLHKKYSPFVSCVSRCNISHYRPGGRSNSIVGSKKPYCLKARETTNHIDTI